MAAPRNGSRFLSHQEAACTFDELVEFAAGGITMTGVKSTVMAVFAECSERIHLAHYLRG